MKGLNIKKVAAIGIGAALIGSALAPVVSANQVPGGLSGLDRSDIVSATGQPVVDVVVGSNAAVSDVVWAGNIAARVAQLATTSVAGGAGEVTGATVDVTVGGQTVVSGAGELVEINLPGYAATSVTNTRMPSLINNTSYRYRFGHTTDQTTTLSESIDGNMLIAGQMQTGSSYYAVGELIGKVERDALVYNVELGASNIDLTTLDGSTGLDSNSSYNIRLPIFGKEYVLDEVKAGGSELVFYATTLPVTLSVGESLAVKSADGSKEYTLRLLDITRTSTNAPFTAAIQLLDNGTVVDSKTNIASGENLKDKFNVALADVYISELTVSDISQDVGYATIRTGEERLVMRDGRGFPFTDDPAVDNVAQWRAYFTPGNFNGFEIRNYWSYERVIGSETNTSKYALKVGEEIELPNNFGKFELVGLQDKPMTELSLGNGELRFSDRKGSPVRVPFYVQFDFAHEEVSQVSIGNENYSFWVETSANDFNIMYAKGIHNPTERPTAGATWRQSNNVNFNVLGTSGGSTYVLDGNQIALDLGVRGYTGTASQDVNYILAADNTSGIAYLLLAGGNSKAGQTFEIYNRGGDKGTEIKFLGTQVDNPDVNNVAGFVQPYFLPNMSEVLTTVLGNSLVVDLNNDGNEKTIQYDDDVFYAALFRLQDATSVEAYHTDFAVRADAQGDVWNYNDLQDKTNIEWFGPVRDANNADWGTRAIRDGTDYIQAAVTRYGTEVMSDNSLFLVNIPEERRLVEAYLGSSDTTTSIVGGGSITGLGVGQTGTASGVSVTVDAVSGMAEGADGVAIVKAGDLVRTDAASGKARSIIVGGFVVNSVARNVEVANGNTLEDLLVSSGDYVAALLTSGNVVVAGYTAADTGSAARELINALDALI